MLDIQKVKISKNNKEISLPYGLIESNSSVNTLITLSEVTNIPNASFDGLFTTDTASLNTFLAVQGNRSGWNACSRQEGLF